MQLSAQDAPVSRAAAAQILIPGSAFTPAGPAQLTALGPISAFIINGTTAQAGAQTPLQPGAQAAQTGQTGAQAAPATGANPAPAAQNVPPTLQLITGGDLSVRLTSVQMPGGAPLQSAPATPQTAGPAPQTPGPLGQPAAQPSLNVPGATPQTAQATPQTQPGLVLPKPGGLPAPTPTPPQTVQPTAPLATLTGTVTSLSPSGAPVIQIDTSQNPGQVQGQIQLNVRANVPVGTVITFEVAAQTPPQPGAQPGAQSAAPTPLSTLPFSGPAGAQIGWPTLAESLTLLQRTDPQAAAQLAQSIPDGGPHTAVAVIAFVQAMRTGDPRLWPGDGNLRALERAGARGAHLASQLSGEVSELASRARDVGGEWRSIPIPWNADGRVERINLVTRREDADDEEQKKQGGGKGTRFLIDLELSKLGSMQLDGMFKKETRGFDLMIRTKEPLPDNMRRDLTGMFANSNAAMGLKGGLSFQVVKKFPDPVGSENPSARDKPGLYA